MKDVLIAFLESYQRMGALSTIFLFGYVLLVLLLLTLVGVFAVTLRHNPLLLAEALVD